MRRESFDDARFDDDLARLESRFDDFLADRDLLRAALLLELRCAVSEAAAAEEAPAGPAAIATTVDDTV